MKYFIQEVLLYMESTIINNASLKTLSYLFKIDKKIIFRFIRKFNRETQNKKLENQCCVCYENVT